MTEQKYLISVGALLTSDDCDIVPKATFVVAQSELASISIQNVADGMLAMLKDAPISNRRPMTDYEIAAWRESDD